MKIDKKQVKTVFEDYTSGYNAKDPKIKLKIDHTYRVAELCVKIARAIHLDEQVCEMAWLAGMLHDVGRFEQIRQYGTFSDADSVDHAAFGADLLFQEGLLERFAGAESISESEKRLLELIIRSHNRYRLKEGLPDSEIVQCNILRDADKIDILRVNYETPMEEIYNVSVQELRQSAVTEEVKQCFREKHAVPRVLKKTPIDNLVSHICLVFELVYPVSRQLVKEQGYLDKLLQFESENEQTKEWFKLMKIQFSTEKIF